MRGTRTSLDRADWDAYFEDLLLDGGRPLVAVERSPTGAPRQDGPLWSLHWLRYDAVADELELGAGLGLSPDVSMRCFVSCPRTIVVEELGLGMILRVCGADGVETRIHLSERDDSGEALELAPASLDRLGAERVGLP